MREALEPQSACNEGGTQDAISRNQHAMRDIIKWRTMPAAAWALLPWLELRTTSARTAPAPSAMGTRGLWREGGPGAEVSTCMLLGEVVNGHQRSSAVISGHQRSSAVISGHQWSSAVISGHQRSSEVLRGPQRSSVVLSAYLAGRASSGPRARATGVEELHYSRHARGTRRAAAD